MKKYILAVVFTFMTLNASHGMRALTPEQEGLLTRIQGFLNGIKTMRSKFIQVTDRETRHGTLKWLRPYHIRFDYAGDPLLHLSSDETHFTQQDADGLNTYEVWRTPASLLLSPSLNFKKDAEIKNLAQVDDLIMMEIAQKDDPDGPSLTLIFRPTPFALIQWKMVDASGNVTDVVLVDIEVGIPMHKTEFTLK